MTNWIRNNKGVLLLILALTVFRSSIANWNYIPSGSMRPTLLEGDMVAYDPTAYDLKIPFLGTTLAQFSDPQRGDIALFYSPKDGTRLIKRVIGIPGDSIEIRQGTLLINGVPANYDDLRATTTPVSSGKKNAIQATEILAGKEWMVQHIPELVPGFDIPTVIVPEGHYMMLGDNRENSADSRFFGFVNRDQIIGKATRVIVSADIVGDNQPRLQRILKSVR